MFAFINYTPALQLYISTSIIHQYFSSVSVSETFCLTKWITRHDSAVTVLNSYFSSFSGDGDTLKCIFPFDIDLWSKSPKPNVGEKKRKKDTKEHVEVLCPCPAMFVPFYLTYLFDFDCCVPLPSSIHSIPFFSRPKVHCFRCQLRPKKRVIWESHVSWCFMFYHHPFSFCLSHLIVSFLDWVLTFGSYV